ncbi:23S rRNA (adenine(2030)-N(6))-methyltransferase RlmJ [Alcanivorax sp. JB21]|uniref:23S rRNA (adenine(2030)-N(6))-methyltransferase RlmJ n=1 Tax=Alcanivorax limicola TaxID=2874102 RepID=UPI001CBAD599|nr:23S rRNA (adenine(2030)-N(6))-methyltransferase RlmJ [Alcanivorax limicola]MBZ2187911.1 23S rRNA (adenine(2030)-N(6))-methyltransferase RlmJ [Alcanivorax limicola]
MLSYQHGYHAGNFADVHKHVVLSLILAYLRRKPGPLSVLDFYAGRGRYDLHGAQAAKTGEAAAGIMRLLDQQPWPTLLDDYREALMSVNKGVAKGTLVRYPGSPLIARHVGGDEVRLTCCELHPMEFGALAELFRPITSKPRPRVQLHKRDALEAMTGMLPPTPRRGLAILDPSYELRDDYSAMAKALTQALKRWSTGVYLLWYPLLPDARHERMLRSLRAVVPGDVVQSELIVRKSGAGMHGSGVLVINPPYVLAEQLASLQDWFATLSDLPTGQGGAGGLFVR